MADATPAPSAPHRHAGRAADLAGLSKLRLSLAIASSALAGYILQRGAVTPEAGVVFMAVLSVAAGCGALNNVQDRTLDATLTRTCGRPLPAGRVRPATALILAGMLMSAGLAALAAGPFPLSAALATAAAAACYNGLYTPMKRRTLHALTPGIVCGALPPLAGWLAAGGSARDPAVWALMVAFGLWQPPHFWLIVLAHPGDYGSGRLPSMLRLFSRAQLARILFAWVAALSLSLPALLLVLGRPDALLAAAMSVDTAALLGVFAWQLFGRPEPRLALLFASLNSSVLLAVALLVVRRLTGWL